MDRRDRLFNDLNGALKSVFHKLKEDGIGAVMKHATVVTPQEEELLWSTGTIGVSSPLSLQRAVFYYVGKVFCLRGGEEQRSLKNSQFRREKDSYVYVENGSKNCSGTSTRIAASMITDHAIPLS